MPTLPDRILWNLSANMPLAILATSVWLILMPGTEFWSDLPLVLIFMLMGEMCSEAMMRLILLTLANAGLLMTCIALFNWSNRHTRIIFGYTPGHRLIRRFMPPENLWNSRLSRIQ